MAIVRDMSGNSPIGFNIEPQLIAPRRGLKPAYQQILDAVAAIDSDASVYNADDPNTRTVRVDGDDIFVEAIADGMGNRPALVQNEAADQPKLLKEFGERNAVVGDGGVFMRLSSTFTAMELPWFEVLVFRDDTPTNDDSRVFMVDGNSPNHGAMFRRDNNEYSTFYGSGTEIFFQNFVDNDPHIFGVLNEPNDPAMGVVWVDSEQTNTKADINPAKRLDLVVLADRSNSRRFVGPVGLFILITNKPTNEERDNLFNLIHQLYDIPKAI